MCFILFCFLLEKMIPLLLGSCDEGLTSVPWGAEDGPGSGNFSNTQSSSGVSYLCLCSSVLFAAGPSQQKDLVSCTPRLGSPAPYLPLSAPGSANAPWETGASSHTRSPPRPSLQPAQPDGPCGFFLLQSPVLWAKTHDYSLQKFSNASRKINVQ